jgi:hypothetical protein
MSTDHASGHSTSGKGRPCGDCALDHKKEPIARSADSKQPCEHFAAIRKVDPGTDGCAECLALGKSWTELRVCLTCGHVGCCEDSPGRHALAHFESTGHPMIVSYERLETWGWCFIHRRYFDPMPPPLPQRPYVWQAWLARLFGQRAPTA